MKGIELEMAKILINILNEEEDIYGILLGEGFTEREVDKLLKTCED